MSDHVFEIVDEQSRQEWSSLLGYEIKTNVVCMNHDDYVENAVAISEIQMMAALRIKQ